MITRVCLFKRSIVQFLYKVKWTVRLCDFSVSPFVCPSVCRFVCMPIQRYISFQEYVCSRDTLCKFLIQVKWTVRLCYLTVCLPVCASVCLPNEIYVSFQEYVCSRDILYNFFVRWNKQWGYVILASVCLSVCLPVEIYISFQEYVCSIVQYLCKGETNSEVMLFYCLSVCLSPDWDISLLTNKTVC